MGIIQEANQAFNQKNYQKALKLYERAFETFGFNSLKYNIALCKKYLENYTTNSNNEKNITIKESILNKYFDNIYVVNLKHKVDDRLKIAHHLKKHGICFEVFEATNGYYGEPLKKYKEYSQRPLGELKRYSAFSEREKQRGKPFIESPGAIGYIYTYLNILEDAKKNSYNRILILEDDIILINNFEKRFTDFIKSIDSDWKILQLGASQYGWFSVDKNEALNKGYYLPRRLDTCGSFAIAIDSSIYDELIEAESSFEAPFDHLPMGEIYEKYLGKCFVAYPNLIIPDVSSSTIRGSRDQISHSKKMGWSLEEFDYPLSKPSIAIIINSKKNLKYYSNFANTSNQPFSLRLYFYTTDGLRPIHNTELLESPENKICPIDNILHIPESDYIATIDKDEILTEKDIIQYIEYQTRVRQTNPTNLKELKAVVTTVVKDRVTVIIPTYKRPKNLKNALESVVNQDYPDIEVIVISDNGTESEFNIETRQIVESFQNMNPNCNVIFIEHKINRNGSAARNTGILHSTGEYICFLDDDDIYLPGRLSKSIDVLKRTHKNIGAVYCGFLGWNSPKNDLNRYKKGNLIRDILHLDYKKHYLHTNTATYKRQAVLELNGFDESYRRHQDLEFNLRFFEKYEIETVEECLVRLNPEPSNTSNKVYNKNMLEIKNKFLNQFHYLIDSFEDPMSIYKLHWNEVKKYSHNINSIKVYLAPYYKNGLIEILKDKLDIQKEELSIFPIGTCRIHEALSYVQKYQVNFASCGYFHSFSQAVDLLKILNKEKSINHNIVKYFFRKDGLPNNTFDKNLWDDQLYIDSLNRIQNLLEKSHVIFLEVSSLKSWSYHNFHIQGNPNYYKDIPYSEVWKEGYYKKYAPDMNVFLFEEDEKIILNRLHYINNYLMKSNKIAFVVGHLNNPKSPNAVREHHNKLLKTTIAQLKNSHIIYFDISEIVAKYGFRKNKDNSIDIHHLTVDGVKAIAKKIESTLDNL